MESPVDFQILRRKSEQIGNFRCGAGFFHTLGDVVAIVKKCAAGAESQVRQNLLLRELRLRAVERLDAHS